MNKEEITEIIRKLSYTGYTEQDIKSEAIRIIENLQKKAELADHYKHLYSHYKHLYSKVKKQKDDVVEYVNSSLFNMNFATVPNQVHVKNEILDRLGENEEC